LIPISYVQHKKSHRKIIFIWGINLFNFLVITEKLLIGIKILKIKRRCEDGY